MYISPVSPLLFREGVYTHRQTTMWAVGLDSLGMTKDLGSPDAAIAEVVCTRLFEEEQNIPNVRGYSLYSDAIWCGAEKYRSNRFGFQLHEFSGQSPRSSMTRFCPLVIR